MNKVRTSILRNEDPSSAANWMLACEKFDVEYEIINLTAFDWVDKIDASNAHFFLLRPPGKLEHFKTLYDERVYIITKVLGYNTYPSFEECYIYENKKNLSYYLRAKNIPHPQTCVFYDKETAFDFVDNTLFPIVAKTSIGASGSGVNVFRSKEKAKQYIRKAFSKSGVKRAFGPNRVTGSPAKWLKEAIQSPSYFVKKLRGYLTVHRHGQKGYVIFQKYIPHEFEWRVAKIGESYFAHKKVKYKDKASGTTGIDYINPPMKLLGFVKALCERNNFNFMAVDLFEDGDSGYLVNELQTIFGHVQDYILTVDGVPGRYIFKNDQFVFEPGDFNTNKSYDLRLEEILKLYNQKP
jgi:hypothetical protein